MGSAEQRALLLPLSRIETVSDTVTMVDPLRSRKPDCLYLDCLYLDHVSEKHRVGLVDTHLSDDLHNESSEP